MTYKGYIYEIYNPELNCYYIGSTRQQIPKKRLYRHRQDCRLGIERYNELFNCKDMEPQFKVIDECDYNGPYELREKENYYLNYYRQNGKTLTNKNMAYVPEHMKATALKNAKMKYAKSKKGKEMRKWQNYRHIQRKKIKSALEHKFANVPKEEGSQTEGLETSVPSTPTSKEIKK